MNITLEALKATLSSPLALFLLMCLASIANGTKQLAVVKQTGKSMTCLEYWSHWPETLTTIITNVIAFALLVMTDQLNFASALGVGYGTNSISDLLLKGGRSYALKSTPDDMTKLQPKQEPPK